MKILLPKRHNVYEFAKGMWPACSRVTTLYTKDVLFKNANEVFLCYQHIAYSFLTLSYHGAHSLFTVHSHVAMGKVSFGEEYMY